LAAEDSVKYPVSFNGKMRFTVDLPKSMPAPEVEVQIRAMEQTAKWVGDKSIVKVIVVPGRIVNIVLK
jgi:leucyl-tRNA synthetase